MALISLRDLTISFGGHPLLDGAQVQIEKGERICLIGRNGAGKSTLMKIIQGELEPDAGQILRQDGLKTAYLLQELPRCTDGTVFAIVAAGLGDNVAAAIVAVEADELDETAASQAQKTAPQRHRVERVLTQLNLDPQAQFSTLSGGLKRRVLLAKALVDEPDILLLDEPTNHLDIDSIAWLEGFLAQYRGTLLFVTHDRIFLRRLATRMLELDRGQLTSWACDYDTFVKRKWAQLEAEEAQHAAFDKKLAEEESWIRQGIKARRTRNEGRVRALEKLRTERGQRRQKTGKVELKVQEADRSGEMVIETKGLRFAYDDQPVVQDFSMLIMRGDKIGLIGPNGSGKTTLLRLLLGQLEPQAGSVRHGTHLQVAYYDQLRGQLDEHKTAWENVAGQGDTVTVNGATRHVLSYMKDFLFTAERARLPVWVLSGGERNRLLLARLFTRPANVLVLDEPTNDLDVETLELLEEQLLNFGGTLLLVSHDRALLNHAVTSTLAFAEDGRVKEYIGGYDDYLRQRPTAVEKVAAPATKAAPKGQRNRKLSYKEGQELAALPQRIEVLEEEQSASHTQMADPLFYQKRGDQVAAATTRLAALTQELETAYQRWAELEEVGVTHTDGPN
jgi:ATP-binding cassette subfamily F protein uup